MSNENNKIQIDIENLFKQNVNDLSAIKELYRKLKEVEEKFSQIKYIDSTLANKLKKEYENLKKFILDENVQLQLDNKIDEFNEKLTNDIDTINSHLDTNTNDIKSRYINVKYPPNMLKPAKGDGVTDDTQALKDIFSCVNDGDTVYFPKGDYKTTDTLTITRAINLKMQGCIVGHHSNTILLLKNDEPQGNFSANKPNVSLMECEFNVDRDLTSGDKTVETSIGVEIWNAFYPRFTFKKIINNYIGVKFKAKKFGTGYAGITYGTFFVRLLNNYFCNLLMEADTDGFITQNQFYGGSYSGGVLADESIHIWLNNIGNSVINENTFIGSSLEGHMKVGVKMNNASSNKFISLRYEMPKCENIIYLEESRFNCFSQSDYFANFMRQGKFYINMSNPKTPHNNLIEYIDYQIGSIVYYDGVYNIRPNKNLNGIYGSTITDSIPQEWDVNILIDGFSDKFIYANSNNVLDGQLTLPLYQNTKYTISTQVEVTVSSLVFSKPPKNTKEFIIDFRYSTSNNITLTTDETIGSIIDQTGNNCVIPKGKKFIKMLYRYCNNQLYITDMY